jgi:hypothetical protein
MEGNIATFKSNRLLIRISLALFAIFALALVVDSLYFNIPRPWLALLGGAAISGYWYAAQRYGCPYCGERPTNKEYVVTYRAKECQSCGHELP